MNSNLKKNKKGYIFDFEFLRFFFLFILRKGLESNALRGELDDDKAYEDLVPVKSLFEYPLHPIIMSFPAYFQQNLGLSG